MTAAELVEFYSTNLRSGLFSAFMTITGFMFTLHAFLIVTLYKELYSKDSYQKRFDKTDQQIGVKGDLFRPLRNISKVLFVAICISLFAAISQMTFGLIKKQWAVWTCLGAAAAGAFSFFAVIIIFRNVMVDFFNFIAREHEKDTSSS